MSCIDCIFWRMVQYLSQSIIHPVQEWPWSWRKVWFFGGVRVHIIIDDKLVIYGSPRSCSQHFTRFPLLRRPLFVNVPFWVVWWASAQYGSHRATSSEVRPDFQIWFSRAFRCSRRKHVRIPHAVSWYQIHHRLWFCCDSFFTCIFWCSFRHRFKIIDRTNTKDDSIHHVWSFPSSICQRVGS